MSARYLLNSAVITAPGRYEYVLISLDEAHAWYRAGRAVSTIGYQETADALGGLLEAFVPVDRRMIRMEPDDEALVFRIVLPPGTPRIQPGDKGRLTPRFIEENCEIGILRRMQ